MKNTIKKVALLGNGSKGLKAIITQFRTINNMYVPKELVEKQKVAVPSNLMSSFRKLRYYLLETTERIPQEWKDMSLFVNGEFDQGKKLVGDAAKRAWAECQDLLDRTLIDSVETTNADGSLGYKIVGRIASKDSGYISNTESPLITDEHSTIFYREVADIVGTLFEQTLEYLYGKLELMETTVQQMIEEDSSVADLTEEEQLARAAKLLEKRGCFIIPSDEDTAKAIGGGNAVTDADDDEFGQVEVKDTIYDHTAGDETFSEFEVVGNTDGEQAAGDEGKEFFGEEEEDNYNTSKSDETFDE